MSSQEKNHLNSRVSEVVSERPNANGEAEYLLDPTEIEAMGNFFLLLDQWDRGEVNRED